MKKTLAALVTAVLALTLSSCGSNDDAKASKAISDSIMKEQKASGSSDVFQMKQEEADCIGDGFVDKIGTDQLQEYKILTKELKPNKDVTGVTMSKDDAKAATDVFFDCTDVPAIERAVIRLLSNEAESRRMGLAGRERVSKEFRKFDQLQRIEDALQRCVSE